MRIGEIVNDGFISQYVGSEAKPWDAYPLSDGLSSTLYLLIKIHKQQQSTSRAPFVTTAIHISDELLTGAQ